MSSTAASADANLHSAPTLPASCAHGPLCAGAQTTVGSLHCLLLASPIQTKTDARAVGSAQLPCKGLQDTLAAGRLPADSVPTRSARSHLRASARTKQHTPCNSSLPPAKTLRDHPSVPSVHAGNVGFIITCPPASCVAYYQCCGESHSRHSLCRTAARTCPQQQQGAHCPPQFMVGQGLDGPAQ